MFYRPLKRAFDLMSALLALIFLSVPIAVLALLVRLKMGAPVLFSQERMGRNEKSFRIYKFRTMTDDRDAAGALLPDGQRLTRLGEFLRSTSLDELPELVCILKGDMSVVGPRPLPTGYLPYFTERERQRFLVRSGLIPPELHYGNTMPTWEEQLSWDADYAIHMTFIMDVRIFSSVFRGLLTRNRKDYGAYARPTLPEERACDKNKADV